MWSASPLAQTAPQASDSADKQGLLLQGIGSSEGMRGGSFWGCVWCEEQSGGTILNLTDIRNMKTHRQTNYSTLSLLCLLAWSLPFALSSPPVEQRKGLAEVSQRSKTPSVPHCEQAFASRPYTLWYFDVPWGALWFLLSLAGRVPGHQVSVPSGRVRRACESVGCPRRRANERAGLSIKGIGGKWS